MTDIVDNETGEVKTVAGTALALNTNETLAKLQKEVTEEFVTSDHEVYKEALRSLLVQEQKLQKQIADIQREIKDLDSAKVALDDAFRKIGRAHV